MKKVLLIEDEKDILLVWKVRFSCLLKGKELVLLTATSMDEARNQFALNKDIGVIVFDGCIEGLGAEPNTQALVSDFRKSFIGPMIAASSNPKYTRMLLDAGCTHECKKEDVPEMVVEILCLR